MVGATMAIHRDPGSLTAANAALGDALAARYDEIATLRP
jgi:hypothetical protein